MSLDLAFGGGWTQAQGWQGRLTALQAEHAGLVLDSQAAVPLALGRRRAAGRSARRSSGWRWTASPCSASTTRHRPADKAIGKRAAASIP